MKAHVRDLGVAGVAVRFYLVPAVPARRLKVAALTHGYLSPRQMRPPDTTPNNRAAPGEPAPARLYAVADGYHERQRPSRGRSSP